MIRTQLGTALAYVYLYIYIHTYILENTFELTVGGFGQRTVDKRQLSSKMTTSPRGKIEEGTGNYAKK